MCGQLDFFYGDGCMNFDFLQTRHSFSVMEMRFFIQHLKIVAYSSVSLDAEQKCWR